MTMVVVVTMVPLAALLAGRGLGMKVVLLGVYLVAAWVAAVAALLLAAPNKTQLNPPQKVVVAIKVVLLGVDLVVA